MKFISFFLVSWLCSLGVSANYYVSALTGNNTNSGLSILQAKATIQAAADLTNPGDTVFIMAGTYTSNGNVLNISRTGTASGQIVYTNYPGSLPKLQASVSTYLVINVTGGTNYITINGLEISGYGVNLDLATDTIAAQNTESCPVIGSPATSTTFVVKYNGNGISIGGKTAGEGCHHIVVSNNKVHDCTAAGIGFGKCDYVTVKNNTVYNNCWYTIYGTSGISFGNSYNYDGNTTTYRNVVINNVCYGNRLYSPWNAVCKITDGNGIILDIPLSDYNGKTLVANNICYNNGGSGIHTLSMNHTDFFNNIAYYNSASPEINGGEIYAYAADDVKFYNNILVARPGKNVNNSRNSTNLLHDYNVYFGGSTVNFVGTHSLIQDPKFMNASTDPAVADFHLQQGSFAINNGDNAHVYPTDRDGVVRPAASVADMGAYESIFSGNVNTCNGTRLSKILGNGNGTGEPGAIFFGPYDSKPGISNQQSRHAIIYPQGLISASGGSANSVIAGLQFRRAVQVSSTVTTPSAQTIPDNSIIRIYLRNEAADNFGSSAFDWKTILPSAVNPAVLVYAGEASPLTGNSGGWKPVQFQISFTYSGTNLGVYIEYLQKGSVTSGTDINWIYDNGGSQPLYNTAANPNQLYASKAASSTGSSSITDNLATNNERRPVIGFDYCASITLPVTLSGFNAIPQSGNVYLHWLTANETNNAGFEVQRSSDGHNFEAIGFVVPALREGTYHFTDNAPLKGTGYYRLLQKDNDGKFKYSLIVSASISLKQLNVIRIYPNPVTDRVKTVVSFAGADQVATISLRDLKGRTVATYNKQLKNGDNNLDLNLSGLTHSTYLLVVELANGERIIKKFTKM